MTDNKKITLIVPVLNEENNLNTFFKSVCKVIEAINDIDWEFLFVDDGSTDHSWTIIKQFSKRDDRVKGISLSRNFGKEMALTAGVETIKDKDAVICLDADLQHPPEKIPEFLEEWKSGSEIVVGIRKEVSGYSLIKKIGSKAFYQIMQKFSDVNIPPNSTDFRLLDKKVVQTICTFSERTRMFRGLIDWLGFKKSNIYFAAPNRISGEPGYSLKKLFDLAINSFTSFSLLPLRITGYLGIIVCIGSGFLLIYMGITDFINFQFYTPQAYFAVFNTFLSGILLSAIGMIALYIGHIHTEVVNRPLYIIREKSGRLN